MRDRGGGKGGKMGGNGVRGVNEGQWRRRWGTVGVSEGYEEEVGRGQDYSGVRRWGEASK